MANKLHLSNEVIKTLEENIMLGVPIKYAVELAGISQETYFRWMREAEKTIKLIEKEEREPAEGQESMFLQFLQSMKKARSAFIRRNIGNIQKHSQRTWQCSAWILERMDPENFGRKMTLEGNTEKPVSMKVDGLSEAIQDVIQMIDNYPKKSDKQ